MTHVPISNQTPPPEFFESLRSGMAGDDAHAFFESGVIGEFAPAFELQERPSLLRIQADVPGVRPGDLSIFLSEKRLTVCGHREPVASGPRLSFRAYERTFGSFWRTFRFAETVDGAHARAFLQRGVLTISVPKSAAGRPQRRPRQPTSPSVSVGTA